MPNVAEMKKRMTPGSTPSGEWSVLFKSLQKQMAQMQQMVKEQTIASRKQVQASDTQLQYLERIHDRMDAVAVESRVTNVLLSELVALHQTVITENTDEVREAVRNDAYRRVRNAE